MPTIFSSTYGTFVGAPRSRRQRSFCTRSRPATRSPAAIPTDCLAIDPQSWSPDALGTHSGADADRRGKRRRNHGRRRQCLSVSWRSRQRRRRQPLAACGLRHNPFNGQPTCLGETTLHFGKIIPKSAGDDRDGRAALRHVEVLTPTRTENDRRAPPDRHGRAATAKTSIVNLTEGSVAASSIVTLDPRTVN